MRDGRERMRRAGRNNGGSPIPSRYDADEQARIERTSASNHEWMASKLWEGADAFGHVVSKIETMGKHGWQAIVDEPEGADLIVIEGPKIIRALRAIAMRLDRAVMVKASKGD